MKKTKTTLLTQIQQNNLSNKNKQKRQTINPNQTKEHKTNINQETTTINIKQANQIHTKTKPHR